MLTPHNESTPACYESAMLICNTYPEREWDGSNTYRHPSRNMKRNELYSNSSYSAIHKWCFKSYLHRINDDPRAVSTAIAHLLARWKRGCLWTWLVFSGTMHPLLTRHPSCCHCFSLCADHRPSPRLATSLPAPAAHSLFSSKDPHSVMYNMSAPLKWLWH